MSDSLTSLITLHFVVDDMRPVTLKIEIKLQKCSRMGITIFKIFIWEVYRRIYVRESRFTAPPARHRKTKFPTEYPTIYLSTENFEYGYPLIKMTFKAHFLPKK